MKLSPTKLRDTEWCNSQLLGWFLKGLCNDTLRIEVRRRGATTIDSAVYVCKEYVQAKESCLIEGKNNGKKITTKTEIDLVNFRGKSKDRREVNAMETESDFPNSDTEWEDGTDVNALQSAGYRRPQKEQLYKPRPNLNSNMDKPTIICYHCSEPGHIKSECPALASTQKEKPVSHILKFSPAQERNIKKKQRFFKGNKVNNVNEESEECTDGEIFAEVDDDDVNNMTEDCQADEDNQLDLIIESINALKSRQNRVKFADQRNQQKKNPRFSVNAVNASFNENTPNINVNGFGKVYLDSGSHISGISREKVPRWCKPRKVEQELVSITGKLMKFNEEVTVNVEARDDGIVLVSPKQGKKITFKVLDIPCHTFLGWSGMAQLKIDIHSNQNYVETKASIKWSYGFSNGVVSLCAQQNNDFQQNFPKIEQVAFVGRPIESPDLWETDSLPDLISTDEEESDKEENDNERPQNRDAEQQQLPPQRQPVLLNQPINNRSLLYSPAQLQQIINMAFFRHIGLPPEGVPPNIQSGPQQPETNAGDEHVNNINVPHYIPSIKRDALHKRPEGVCTLDKDTVQKMNSRLPFARVLVLNSEAATLDQALPAAALLDSGASIGLIKAGLLDNSSLKFEEGPVDKKANSFTGDPIKLLSKVTVYLDFGTHKHKRIQLYKYQGPSAFHIVLGWKQMQALSLDLKASTHSFSVDGYPFSLYNDHSRKNDIIGNILVEKEVNLSPMDVLAHDSVTLRQNEECQIILKFKDDPELTTGADVGDSYFLEPSTVVKESGLEVDTEIVQLSRLNQRGKPLGTMCYVRVPEDHPQPFVSIVKDQVMAAGTGH